MAYIIWRAMVAGPKSVSDKYFVQVHAILLDLRFWNIDDINHLIDYSNLFYHTVMQNSIFDVLLLFPIICCYI